MIGPVGHRRAGKNPQRHALGDAARKGIARPGLADHLKGLAHRHRAFDGVSIHRRADERRLITARLHRFGQHPPRGMGERHILNVQRVTQRENAAQGFIDRDHAVSSVSWAFSQSA